MCRNHSHITTELTGLVTLGPTRLVELRVIHQLVVELPYGEKWTKPSGSTLLLPVSMSEPLPALRSHLMEVCYTPSFYMGDFGTTTMEGVEVTVRSAGVPGVTKWGATEPLPQTTRSDDDDVPW